MNFFNGNTWKLRNNRLLKNDGPNSEIEKSSINENLKEPEEQNKLKDISESSEIDEKIKKVASNSMYTYIKKLDREYPNKKGLKRLDCHYEKKLFGEIYELDKIAGNMKSKNSYFKKVILKRYSLRFVIFSLVVLFGIVTSILGYISTIDNPPTNISCKTNNQKPCSFCKSMSDFLPVPSSVLFFPLTIAYLSFVIYIFSKVRKYKRLKRKYVKISLV
ncbi:hypothetical protein PVBG_05745 [Plasmodium vivax Brazil I]|uniref:Uncharacterized protein n=1 Tax=Plasmodium vivax (strain Brazil I) TaxID=1033975 RepID=A0A0J9SK52_PLAV1|nr:hypothetical protein PVBG_05745 [Plasmodium vivax Brazil I]